MASEPYEQSILPARHHRMSRGPERAPGEKVRRLHGLYIEPQSTARDCARDVGFFHEAKLETDDREVFRDLPGFATICLIHPRNIGGIDAHNNVAAVQDLVVLQIMHQGRRHAFRMTGQENGRAGDAMGNSSFDDGKEFPEWQNILARPLGQ